MPLGLLPSPAVRVQSTASQLSPLARASSSSSAAAATNSSRAKSPSNPDGFEPQQGVKKDPKPFFVTSVPVKTGSSSFAVPGFDVRCLDPETGDERAPGALGHLAIKLPLPPGALSGLFNDRARFEAAYMGRFPGFYDCGDSG